MSNPSQKYLRALPPDALIDCVKRDAVPGRPYSVTEFWHWYNGHRGFCSNTRVFRYACLKAGMVEHGDKIMKPVDR